MTDHRNKVHKPKAKAKAAGKTNTLKGSLVLCEVKLENGDWISPGSCETFYIDETAKFPDIEFEFKSQEDGPYDWSWEIIWAAMACPQAKDKNRFKPKHNAIYSEKGSFKSNEKNGK